MFRDTTIVDLRTAPTFRAQCLIVVSLFVAGFLDCRLFDQHTALATINLGPGIVLATTYSMKRAGRLRMLTAMLGTLALAYAAAGVAPVPALVAAVFACLQAWVGAAVLGKVAPRGLDLTRAWSIGTVALVALVVVPVFAFGLELVFASAKLDIFGVHSSLVGSSTEQNSAAALVRWVLPRTLGIMLATPLVINFFEVTRLGGDKWRNPERLVILGCTLVVTAITFYSDGALFLFLICPPLVWVGLRLGIRDTAAAVLISLITASIAAAHGHGPSEVLHITASQRPLFLELAYLCAYACILPIAASLETRRYK